MSAATTSIAEVRTDRPVPYMRQLCKHFGHKTEAEFGDVDGHIVLGPGRCDLDASRGDVLVLTVSAPDTEALATVQRVIGSHLERFGGRDDLAVTWRATTKENP